MGSATSSKNNTAEQHNMKGQLVLVLASRHTTDACRDVFEKEFDAEVASTRTVSERRSRNFEKQRSQLHV